MFGPFIAGVGGVVSADIAVPQHDRELRFYSRVLGTGEQPLWRQDLMNNQGMPVIGLGVREPAYADLPLQWMPHIQVVNIARSVQCALERGGSELLHGRGDAGNSQWAVLCDPNGAAFGLIPVVPEEQVPAKEQLVDQCGATTMGCVAWLELIVPNAIEISDFYQAVIGWSGYESTDHGPGVYDMHGAAAHPVARIRPVNEADQGVPPVWLMHLPVGDLAASLRQVKRHGGEVIKASTNMGEINSCAVIKDPLGVVLVLASS